MAEARERWKEHEGSEKERERGAVDGWEQGKREWRVDDGWRAVPNDAQGRPNGRSRWRRATKEAGGAG